MMKEKYSRPQIEIIQIQENDIVTASGPNGHNNGRWGDGNPHSHNGGEGIGAWHGGKNHDNFP